MTTGAGGARRARKAAVRPIAAALLAIFVAGGAAAQERVVPESRAEIQFSYAPVVKRTAPAVVNIYTRTVVHQRVSPLFDDPFFRQFFGGRFPGMSRERVENSLGSGTIVDPSGVIVTNYHVIANADQITVALADRREFDAKIVRSDERSDLAILKIDTKGEKLPYLKFGDPDELEVGDLVLAIGDPFNVGQTVTSGIVSALARTNVGIGDFRSFIQTDAAINPGNSGGPLVNMNGEVVGINTAIFSRSGGSHGVGFAIPATMARAVLRAALTGAPATHPWIGISGETVTAQVAEAVGLAKPEGVVVKEIHPLSPARKSGLKPGDVIESVDGKEVDDVGALKFKIATLAAGDSVTLGVLRNGESYSAKVTVIAPPESPPRDETKIGGDNPLGGTTVANLSPALADELGMDDMLRGVVVTAVAPRSTAGRLGFEANDMVLALNGAEIKSVDGLKKAVGAPRRDWDFTIERNGRVRKFTVGR